MLYEDIGRLGFIYSCLLRSTGACWEEAGFEDAAPRLDVFPNLLQTIPNSPVCKTGLGLEGNRLLWYFVTSGGHMKMGDINQAFLDLGQVEFEMKVWVCF